MPFSPPQQTLVSAEEQELPSFAKKELRIPGRLPRTGGGRAHRVQPRFEFTDSLWQGTLGRNRIGGFDELWGLRAEWFEPVNRRRGGWSGISRIQLTLPDGRPKGLFLKRQSRHFCRLLRNPLTLLPTYQREFENLLRCRRHGIPVPRVVYFGVMGGRRDGRAVLLTEEMEGYRSLSDWQALWQRERAKPGIRRAVLAKTGELIRELHRRRLQHHALKPCNIFLKLGPDPGRISLCLLDLEMMRWHPRPMLRDLLTLGHKSADWSKTDRMRFFLAYLGIERLDPAAKRLWYRLRKRYQRKYPGDTFSPHARGV